MSQIHKGLDRKMCNICGKNLSRKEKVEKHEEQFTGENKIKSKKYQQLLCSFCGKLFKTKGNMKSHEQKTHMNLIIKNLRIRNMRIRNMRIRNQTF